MLWTGRPHSAHDGLVTDHPRIQSCPLAVASCLIALGARVDPCPISRSDRSVRYPPDSKSDDEKCMCHMAVRLVKRVEDDDDLEMLKSMDGLTIKPPEWWRQLYSCRESRLVGERMTYMYHLTDLMKIKSANPKP